MFRAITLNFTDPQKVGEMMDTEIDKRHEEEMRAPKALSTMADALPALGIVAAVLGVIKAMGAINESPDILGHMIGSALVGTLLGVFLSYGLFGPIAARLKGVLEEEGVMLGDRAPDDHLASRRAGPATGGRGGPQIGAHAVPAKFR